MVWGAVSCIATLIAGGTAAGVLTIVVATVIVAVYV